MRRDWEADARREISLAVPVAAPWQSVADLPEGVRISTELPALTRRYLEAAGVKAVVIPSYGATEAKVPDIVDAIVDLTETGSSLRRNGLRILDTVITSYTEFVADPQAYADQGKRAAMEDLLLLLHGAIGSIQCSWVKLGDEACRDVLRGGVNDLGGTLMEETISRMAGAGHGSYKTISQLRAITDPIGRPLRQRTTTYGEPPAERLAAAVASDGVTPAVRNPLPLVTR